MNAIPLDFYAHGESDGPYSSSDEAHKASITASDSHQHVATALQCVFMYLYLALKELSWVSQPVSMLWKTPSMPILVRSYAAQCSIPPYEGLVSSPASLYLVNVDWVWKPMRVRTEI